MDDRRLRCLYVGDPSMTEYDGPYGLVYAGPGREVGGMLIIPCMLTMWSGIAEYSPVSSFAMYAGSGPIPDACGGVIGSNERPREV